MKWEVIDNQRSSLQEYRLIENDDCKLIIKYNPLHRSARITSGAIHRLFFFESAGSLSGKIIFKNEYGLETGNLLHDKFHPQEGSLAIDNKKYRYQLQNNSSFQLLIFQNGNPQPLATCSLPANKTTLQNAFSFNTEAIHNNCCLLGLCWYLSLALVKEKTMAYVTA